MRTRLLAENPEKIEFTLKIEATAKEFEQLRDFLASHKGGGMGKTTPVHQLEQELNSLLAQARKIFWPTEPDVIPFTFMGVPVSLPPGTDEFVIGAMRSRLTVPEYDGGTRDQFGPATP